MTVLLPKNAVPMMLMRVLSILRLAAPSKVIHLPEGYEQSLRSLTSLAMHVVSAITITDDIEQWPMVNEILKSLRHGGIVISGTGGRDALAGYLRYLSDLGVDLMGHREARGSACGSVGGGCGCGSGGCGGHEATPTVRADAAVATTSLNPLLKKLLPVVAVAVLVVAALSSPPEMLSSSNIF